MFFSYPPAISYFEAVCVVVSLLENRRSLDPSRKGLMVGFPDVTPPLVSY